MNQDANYRIIFSQQGSATGSLSSLGNPQYGPAIESSLLCWLHQIVQGKLPAVMRSAGVEFDGHTPMIGYVLRPGAIQSNGMAVDATNVIPSFFQSSTDAKAVHLATGKSGKITLYRREHDMAGHMEVEELTGVQIYGFLKVQG